MNNKKKDDPKAIGSFHYDVIELIEKYEEHLSGSEIGHSLIYLGSDHLMHNSINKKIGLKKIEEAVDSGIKAYERGISDEEF